MAEIIMPKMGDAMEEGVILEWKKNVGDSVAVGDPLFEIETDKSNVEVEAEEAGTLQSIAVPAGQSAPVGSVVAVIGAGAASPAKEAPEPRKAPAAPTNASGNNGAGPGAAQETKETEREEGEALAAAGAASPKAEPVAEPVAAPARPVAATPAPQTPAAPFKPYDSLVGGLPENLGGSASLIGAPVGGDNGATETDNGERVKASPLARAMARSNNLDLATLSGSGTNGEIVKRDVEAALAGGNGQPAPAAPAPVTAAPAAAPSPAPAAAISAGDEVQEYNAMRRTIAKRLAESKATIPHFYVTSEIDVEAMLALRAQINAGANENAARISLNDFLVKATAVALGAHPVVNATFSDNKRIVRRAVNIGIAVSIDDGLIVPVVRDCQHKSLRAIAAETHPRIERARTGKLKPEEYTGGTFTISNLGQYDVENFAAIINPGEGAILAVSSIRPVPAVVDGEIVARRRMKVTLCADHRIMDGVVGAQFLQELKRVIENPLQILA